MLLSKEQSFSENQAITSSAVSTNIIDLGTTGQNVFAPANLVRDVGQGQEVEVLVQVMKDFATLTSLQVSLQMDDNQAFSSPTTLQSTPAIAVADLTTGYRFALNYLPEGITERYMRLFYTVVGSAATAGQITAGIVLGYETAA